MLLLLGNKELREMEGHKPTVDRSISCSTYARGELQPTIAAVCMMSNGIVSDQGCFEFRISMRHEGLQRRAQHINPQKHTVIKEA
jgi:hypothetical protein